MIKCIVEVIYSRPDVYGNRYFAAIVTDTLTGLSCSGKIDTESSVSFALRDRLEWSEFKSIETGLSIRDFNRLTKNWDYMGYNHPLILSFIDNNLK